MGLFDPFRRKPQEPEPAPHRGYYSLHDGLGEEPDYDERDARLDAVDRQLAGKHRLPRDPDTRFWQREHWRDRRKRWWAGRIIAALLGLFVLLVAWLAITAPLNKSLQPIAPPMVTLLAADGTPIARNGAVTDEPVEVAELPPQYQEVIALREYEGLSYAEIADVTGSTIDAVKSRLFKARKSLFKRLRRFFQ